MWLLAVRAAGFVLSGVGLSSVAEWLGLSENKENPTGTGTEFLRLAFGVGVLVVVWTFIRNKR